MLSLYIIYISLIIHFGNIALKFCAISGKLRAMCSFQDRQTVASASNTNGSLTKKKKIYYGKEMGIKIKPVIFNYCI